MFEYIIQVLPGERLARFRLEFRRTHTMVVVGFIVGLLLTGFIVGIWYFFAASNAANWTLL